MNNTLKSFNQATVDPIILYDNLSYGSCNTQYKPAAYIIDGSKKTYIWNMDKNALNYNIFGTRGVIILIFVNGASRCCTPHKRDVIELV